jgi:hypothetical protein
MASTYTLISSQVLASSASSVTFSSIPATYTDLVVRASARTSAAGAFSDLGIVINGNVGTVYSWRGLGGSGSVSFSDGYSGQNAGNVSYGVGNTATANTYNSLEIYIPSYTVAQNKPFSSITVQENNTTAAYILARAQLFSNTTAISSIQITEASGNNLLTTSSFYLYGI